MKHSRRLGLVTLSFTALLAARPAQAAQFVVAEADYTHSAQTTKDSHYRVKPTPETPPDWQSPVDYTGGSVHVRLEVKTKPSDTPTRYQICFEMKQNYCCTDQAPVYTKPGVYEWDTDVEKLWRPGPVIFSQGIVQSALILKDTNNVKPAPENVGEATSQLYMPSDVHVTVTVISTGSVYQAPAAPAGGSGGVGAGGAAASGGDAGGLAGSPTTSGGAGAGGGGASALGGGGATATEPQGGAAGTQPVSSAGAAGAAPTSSGLPDASTDASCSLARPRSPDASWGLGSAAALALVLLRRRLRGRGSRSKLPRDGDATAFDSPRRDHAQR